MPLKKRFLFRDTRNLSRIRNRSTAALIFFKETRKEVKLKEFDLCTFLTVAVKFQGALSSIRAVLNVYKEKLEL